MLYPIFRKRSPKIFLALTFGTISVIAGLSIFVFIEDYCWTDALYMTAITISTVGFGTLNDLTDAGKISVSIYVFYNLGVFAFAVSVISRYVFDGELNRLYKRYMEIKRIQKLRNHVIIIGYGRNGSRACEELLAQKVPFVIIDRKEKEEHIEEVESNDPLNVHYLKGDATLDEVLISAGLKTAEAIIITLPHDADNVYITLTARAINADITIITRASEVNSQTKLLRAGADHVVMPDALGGIYMARLIVKPVVVRFLELLGGTQSHVELDEFGYKDLNFAYRNKPLKDLKVEEKTGITILGIKRRNIPFKFNISPSDKISEGDTIIILGSPENIKLFYQKFSN